MYHLCCNLLCHACRTAKWPPCRVTTVVPCPPCVVCCVLQNGAPREGDEINVVWVVDSKQLPFYRAEVYHQFHNGLGKAFPAAYTRDLKAAVAATGKIGPTGCLELPF